MLGIIKEKNSLNFEGGITLVALIITIIVLIILATVSINAVFKAKFIDLATEGTVNYAEAQFQEEKEMAELDEVLKYAIKKIEDGRGEAEPEEPEPEEPIVTTLTEIQ